MRRHNERLYRAARAIVRDEAEAEDVMQQAYINAYAHLRQFDGRVSFATWLTRIAVNEAISRARRRGRHARSTARIPHSRMCCRCRARTTLNHKPSLAKCRGFSRVPSTRCLTACGKSSCCARSRVSAPPKRRAVSASVKTSSGRVFRERERRYGVICSIVSVPRPPRASASYGRGASAWWLPSLRASAKCGSGSCDGSVFALNREGDPTNGTRD